MSNTMLRWQTDAGAVTLYPSCGRVLQAEIEGERAFWNNPSDARGWNVGGDRLWVAPEVHWYWKTLEKVDFARYEVPEAVDPGNWTVTRTDKNYCRISQQVFLRNHHMDSHVKCTLARSFTLLAPAAGPFFTKQIAWQTDNELWIQNGTPGQKVGLWSLLQVPSGGTLSVRSPGDVPFRNYLSPIPHGLWRKRGDVLHVDITGSQQYKIGIAPNSVTGTMAYARKAPGGYLVIYRKFFPQPWRPYADVPMNDLKGNGDAIQIYNDDGSFGGFGEMECHSPAIQVGAGNDHIMDGNLTIVGFVPENHWPDWLNHWL